MARQLTTVVVPTIGRPSLHALLDSLRKAKGACPEVVVVDDRPGGPALDLADYDFVRLAISGGHGPAAARNHGWRTCRTPWVSFLDDDVVVEPDWLERLEADLSQVKDEVVASQGRVTVPLPRDRRPTDAERGTVGLETARWITADMSMRSRALETVGGFDERFRRAYREDADLGLRLRRLGRIERGQRVVLHPVRAEDDWFSLRQQRGNADDVLMRVLHGPRWRQLAGAPRGALRSHLLTTGAALSAGLLVLAGRRNEAMASAAVWTGMTARFAWSRIAPGPRDRDEVRRMMLTSVAIPFAATYWAAEGRWRHRPAAAHRRLPSLVLFDRDGTLVHDIPYNRDPELVRPVRDAAGALDMLRRAGIPVGVVTNQSGVGRGRIRPEELAEVNARIDALLGPFDTWQVCVHAPEEGCGCRKPQPGLVRQACHDLDVHPEDCVVIGDIGADVKAAQSAGAVGILVPNDATRTGEIDEAPIVRSSLSSATATILRGAW